MLNNNNNNDDMIKFKYNTVTVTIKSSEVNKGLQNKWALDYIMCIGMC